MVTGGFDPNEDVITRLMREAGQGSPTSFSNSDIRSFAQNYQSAQKKAQANIKAKAQLDQTFQKEKIDQQYRTQAQQTLNNLNMNPQDQRSFWEKTASILDAPSRYFTRPVMASGLAALYTLLPGQQGGEEELRRAATLNPVDVFFDKKKREELNKALTKTKLPWGVYTALEIGLDPLMFVPVGRLTKPAKALAKRISRGDELPFPDEIAKKVQARVLKKTPDIPDPVDIDMHLANLRMASNSWAGRYIIDPLVKIPYVRGAIGVLKPRALLKSELSRARAGWLMVRSDIPKNVDNILADLDALPDPFMLNENGIPKNLIKVPKEGLYGLRDKINLETGEVILKGGKPVKERVELTVYDIVQQHKKYDKHFTPQQRAFVKVIIDNSEKAPSFLKRRNLPFNEIPEGSALRRKGEIIIPRFVLSRDGMNQLVSSGAKPLSKLSQLEQTRYYRYMAEGMNNAKRVDYLLNFKDTYRLHWSAILRIDADTQFLKTIKELKGPDDIRLGMTIEDFDEFGKIPRSNQRLADLKAEKKMLEKVEQMRIQTGGGRSLTDPSTLMTLSSLRHLEDLGKDHFVDSLRRIEKQGVHGSANDKLKADIQKALDLNKANKKLALDEKKNVEQGLRSIASRGRTRITEEARLSKIWFPDEVVSEFRQFAANDKKTIGWLRTFSSVNSAGRSIAAGLDWGGQMIQGFPTFVVRPDLWGKAMYVSGRAFISPQWFKGWKAKNVERITRAGHYGTPFSHAEFFEGAAKGTFISSVPVLGNALEHAGAAFNGFGDGARLYLFEAMEPMVEAKARKIAARSVEKKRIAARAAGYPIDEDALYIKELGELTERYRFELGDHAGKMTGVVSNASLGIAGTQEQIEQSFFFAPRYLRATVGLVLDVFQGDIRGELARQSISKMMAGGFLYYMGLSAAIGQEPKLDPTKGDFLSVRINGEQVGFGSAWVSLARTMGKLYNQGERVVEGEDDFLSAMNILDPQESVLGQFIRFKTSPIVGAGWDIFTGRDAIGRPLDDPLIDFPKRVLPFSLQGIVDEAAEDLDADEETEGFLSDVGELIHLPSIGKLDKGTATGAIGDFFGLRTFPSSTWAKRDRRRQALAAETGVNNWDELDPYRQRLLSEKDPELMELDLEVRRFNLERGDDMRLLQQELFDKTDQIRSQYVQSLNQYEMDWRDGKGTGENFRRAVDRLSIDLGARYDEVYSPSSRFAPALAELRGAHDRGNSAPIEQVARDEYVMRLIVGDEEKNHNGDLIGLEDAFGSFNYDERSRREEDMISRYGQDVINNVKLYFDKTATLPPAVREFRELRDKFSPYWEVGDKLAQEMGIRDQWIVYKNKYGSFESDALKEQFPLLDQILSQERSIRTAMRKQSPLLDAFLLRYGYITSPVNKEVIAAGKRAVQQYDANIQFNFPFAIS
jgi:hypothetical protein